MTKVFVISTLWFPEKIWAKRQMCYRSKYELYKAKPKDERGLHYLHLRCIAMHERMQ